MKIQSRAAMAVLTSAVFLIGSLAAQADEQRARKKTAKKAAPGYELSGAPSIPSASNAANSAVQSAVRAARDDADRKAKARQPR